MCPLLWHAGDSRGSNSCIFSWWWAGPGTRCSSYQHHKPANSCCALSDNQFSCIRSSLTVHNVCEITGQAHERAISHYTVDIKHVDKQDMRYQWPNTLVFLSLWILVAFFPWRHNALTLFCHHIGLGGGGAVSHHGYVKRYWAVQSESRGLPGNRTTAVILVRCNKEKYFCFFCIRWYLFV